MKFISVLLVVFACVTAVPAADAPAPSESDLNRAVLDKAERELRRRAFGDAVTTTTGLLQTDPKNVRALLLRGFARSELRESDAAIADFDEVLKLQPRTASALQQRGFEKFKMGKVTESVEDFDQFLELVPNQRPYHWQRGIALYYAGKFAEGKKQFDLHQTVNSADVENAVWHFICAARAEGIEKARAGLIPIQGDGRVPMAQIHSLFAGKTTPEEVLKAAETGQPSAPQLKDRLFYAHLYLGLYHEAHGNTKLARDHIEKAAGPYAQDHYMGDVAKVHARLLKAPAK